MSTEVIFVAIMFLALAVPMIAARFGYAFVNAATIFLVMTTTIITGHIISLFGYASSVGTVLFAAIFLSTDIISELYGHKKAYQTVVMAFIANILLVSIGFLVTQIAPFAANPVSDAIVVLFTFIPRLVFGGLIAFGVSQTIDVYLFALYKKYTHGRHLWLRNIGSTVISQAVDTALVVTIAFYGVLPNLLQLFFTVYIIKVIVALLDTPFCYLARHLSRKHPVNF
jgi:queuosine precursor transporter